MKPRRKGIWRLSLKDRAREVPDRPVFKLQEWGGESVEVVGVPDLYHDSGVALSKDRRYLYYSAVQESESDLILVEFSRDQQLP